MIGPFAKGLWRCASRVLQHLRGFLLVLVFYWDGVQATRPKVLRDAQGRRITSVKWPLRKVIPPLACVSSHQLDHRLLSCAGVGGLGDCHQRVG